MSSFNPINPGGTRPGSNGPHAISPVPHEGSSSNPPSPAGSSSHSGSQVPGSPRWSGSSTSANGAGHGVDKNGSRNGSGNGNMSTRVRVILVGRTGQDAALRHDEQVELIRTHHPLGAVGELANPMDSDSPIAATVIVGEGAVPDDRARAFVASLRRVDPAVRVLVMSTQHAPMYDGSVPPEISPDSLRRLIHGVQVLPEEAEPSPPAVADIGLAPESDEDAVLSALLSGRGTPAPSAPIHKIESPTETASDSPSLDPLSFEARYPREALTPPPLPGSESAIAQTQRDSDHHRCASLPSLLDDDTGLPREDEQPAPARSHHPAMTPIAAPASASAPMPTLDHAPVQAILAGQSPVDAAIASVRAASRIEDLLFLRHGEARERTGQWVTVAPEGPHVKVIHEGNVLGYLISPSHSHAINRITPEELRYLTLWAALSDHETQLREFAFTDELTGAYNRRFFNRFMANVIDQARNSRHYLTLLYFDIDDFKLYNDRFSHSAGDEILISVVALLKSVIRPSDKVCRLGGDEFAVIFYDPSPARPGSEAPLQDARAGGAPQSISEIARRFQKQICAHRFPKLGELAPGTLTVSGGMATFPWDGRNTEELLERADELLMQSKAQGKNLITLGPGAEQVCEILQP